MLKVMKWEFKKQIKQLKWIVVGYVMIFLLMLSLPGGIGYSENKGGQVLLFACSLSLIIGTAGFALYPIYNMLADFNKKYYIMERTTGKSYIVIFIVKLVANLCSCLIASGIGYGGMKLMGRFSTENTTYFFVELNQPYFILMFEFVFLYPIIILFFYMLSSKVSVFKNNRFIGTILGIIILGILAYGIPFKGIAYYVMALLFATILLFICGKLTEFYFEQL